MPHVSVIIDGRSYRMACDDGQQEHLLALGRQLDARMEKLRGTFGEIGDMRLAVMAGIMVADELSETRKRLDDAMRELEAVNSAHLKLAQGAEETQERLSRHIIDVAARLESVADALNRGQQE